MMELVIVRVGEISFGTENIFFRKPMDPLSPQFHEICSSMIVCKEIRYFTHSILLLTKTPPECM